MVPFWKQWNALLQINVEKNKHKHGIYVVPASALYYPPYAPYAPYDNLGFYLPYNYAGLNGGGGVGLRPMPLLYDEFKPQSSTLVCLLITIQVPIIDIKFITFPNFPLQRLQLIQIQLINRNWILMMTI